MQGLAEAQRIHDSRLPSDKETYFRDDELRSEVEDLLREPRPRARYITVTDDQIEQFIAALVAAPDKDIFLENTIGALPRAASNELALHMAVAQQWVRNKEAVGQIIGPTFWQWAKAATIESLK
jgi:hypothetical protein